MAQIRGTAGYNLGHGNPFVGPGRDDATSDPSPLDAIREQTSKIEDWLDTLSHPLKPYVVLFPVFLTLDISHRYGFFWSSLEYPCSSIELIKRANESVLVLMFRYLPAIGRFLIVVTFLEDSLRIFTQWTPQLTYLNEYRHSMLKSCILSPTKG